MLATRIKSLRKAAGLTQVALAKRTGITQGGISAIERGESLKVHGETLIALCAALNTNPKYLTTGKGDPGPFVISSIEQREIIDLWGELDELSRDTLILTARALLERQNKGTATRAQPFPAGPKKRPVTSTT
jgi:transcriptional regulator with XRE-family HTH domain